MRALTISIIFLLVQPAYGQVNSITQLRNQLARARHDTVRVRLYTELAEQYKKVYPPDSTYRLVTQGIPLAHKNGMVAEESLFHLYLGYYYKRLFLSDKARVNLEKALALSKKADSRPTRRYARISYALACVYADQGRVSKAIETAIHSAEEAHKIKDTIIVCSNYGLIALIKEGSHNLPAALSYSRKSVQLVRMLSAKNPQRLYYLTFAEGNLAQIYEKMGQYKRAYPYLISCLNSVVAQQEIDQISEFVILIGYNLVNQKRPHDAIRYVRQATQRKSIDVSAETYEIYALAYQQLGQLDKALLYAQKSYKMGVKQNRTPFSQSTLKTLISIEKAANKYKEALAHYQQLIATNDTLFTLEKNKAVAEVETKYQVNQKEQTIALLNKDAALRKVTLAKKQNELTAQRQYQLLLGLVILGLLFIVSGLFIVFWRERYMSRLLTVQKDAMEHKAEQLQQANKLKDKLFGIIGHDLRSPIATLKVQLIRLKNGDLTPQQFQQSHGRLLKMVDTVYVTLDNLLLWSLIQRKRLSVWPTHLDLVDVCQSLSDLFEMECEFKQIHLIIDLQEAPVVADENQLQIVIRNILQNAIKFTPVGGTIWLSSRVEQGRSVVSIQDSGAGMSAEILQGLNNVSKPRRGTSGEMGVGLGLEVCRELIELNEGKMLIQSEPGKGTRVAVSWVMIKHAHTALPAVAAA